MLTLGSLVVGFEVLEVVVGPSGPSGLVLVLAEFVGLCFGF